MNERKIEDLVGEPIVRGIIVSLIAALCSEILLEGISSLSLNSLGRIAILVVCFYVIHRFACLSLKDFRTNWRDSATLLGAFIVTLAVLGIGRLFTVSIVAYLNLRMAPPGLDPVSFFYAIPFATGGLLLQSVLGLHFGLVFAAMLAVAVGVYFPGEGSLVPYAFITTLVGCVSLVKFRSRSDYLRAGFHIGLFALPLVLGSLLLDPNATARDFIVTPIMALLGGVLCAFIASGLTPLAEYLGGYVTDLRLIEIATLDHPLLKDLSLRAAGTWNHSMVIGMMAEAAADGIGANPVVARVGAYFHDIGKISKPLYFVENQFGEENRHDKLSPSMSALIIRSHVKEGIEMARKHHLPKVIEDMIPQHHGTHVIEYFYEKAVSEAEAGGQEVDRNLYTYPGPKPQTKEAGILMLADGIEAAARTLTEPTLDRIQGLVQKMINKVFSSGELEECELTLKDLHEIAKCFTRVLHSIHHQRIAYDEPAEKVKEPIELLPLNSGETEVEGEQTKPKKENLKRLGL